MRFTPLLPIRYSLAAATTISLLLSACGGGDGANSADTAPTSNAGSPTTPMPPAASPGTSTTPTSPVTPTGTPTPPPSAANGTLSLNSVELAQTHVIPPTGRTMNTADGKSRTLTLLANRAALLMVEPATAGASIQVEVVGSNLGSLVLNTPDKLPATDNGTPQYSSSKYSVLLPKEWVQPGVTLKITRGNDVTTVPLTVTGGINLKVRTVPAFFFGATRAMATTAKDKLEMDGTSLALDYAQEIPVASVDGVNSGDLSFNDFVLPPTGTVAAQAYSTFATARNSPGADGYVLMGQMLSILPELRSVTANNDRNLNVAYWAPMVLEDPLTGKLIGMGGGLTSVGAGNASGDSDNYGGIFDHEMGHGYGMSHAGDMYNSGTYPYPGGSLSGSSWGYDAIRNQLLSPVLPALPCKSSGRQLDASGRCYRQDPMQGGSGDQSAGYRWEMFADYSSALIQGWMNGRIVYNPAAATNASRFTIWSAVQGAYVDASATVSQLQRDMQGNQQVVTVLGNISKTDGTLNRLVVSAAGQGNIPRTFDPTSQPDWDQMKLQYANYCQSTGCDYTLQATFTDGSTQNVLLPKGYHQNNSNTVNPNSGNPLNGASFIRFAVNFSAAKKLKRLDLYVTEFGAKPTFSAMDPASLVNPISSLVVP
ncbi:Peptidase M66 [Collimonas sp. OK307]|nr:Peptidase M66 [Collimonas sp. OK307]